MARGVVLTVKMNAQDRASRVIRKANSAIREHSGALNQVSSAQDRVTSATEKAAAASQAQWRAMKRAGIAATAFVLAGKAVFEFARAGAKAVDQFNILNKQIGNLPKLVADARKATSGMATSRDVVQMASQFRAFGLDVDQVPAALGAVAKTALRTGRDLGFLNDSMIAGIAMLSDMRLDNLGLVGVIKTARAELKAQGGAFTDVQLRAHALRVAIKQLGEANEGIELAKQTSTAFEQLATRFAEAKHRAQELLAVHLSELADKRTDVEQARDAVIDLGRAFADATQRGRDLVEQWGPVTTMSISAAAAHEGAARRTNEAFTGLVQNLDKLDPAARVEAWNALTRQIGHLNEESRDFLRALFKLPGSMQQAATAASAFASVIAAKLPSLSGFNAELAAAGEAAEKVLDAVVKAVKVPKPKTGGPAGVSPERVAALAHMRDVERVATLRREAALAATLGEHARARLEHAGRLAQISADTRDITDTKLRIEAQGLLTEASKLQLKRALLAINQKELENARKLAEADAASAKRRQAELDRATEDARRRAREAADVIGAGISGALGEASAVFAELDANLAALGEPDRYAKIAAGFRGMAANVQGAARTFAEFGDTSLSAGQKAAAGAVAGLGAAQPLVAAFTDSIVERSALMGAFEAAMSVAAYFTGNIPAAIGHGISSAMFFALAGGAAAMEHRGWGGAPPSTGDVTSGPSGGAWDPAARGGAPSDEPRTITINIGGSAAILGTPQALGRAISQQIDSMSGSGMQATAF